MGNLKSPMVSVCMVTYNHEKYIEDAILGVLEQTAEFPIELIVSNDKSTDNTHSVIERIIATHPQAHRIKYYNQSHNLGMMENFIFVLEQAKGKYIATCDGDDYWVDNQKLNRQIRFLENNLEYSFHTTKVSSVDIYRNHFNTVKPKNWRPGLFTKDRLLEDFDIQTSTFVLRNNFILPLWYKEIWSGDFFLAWASLQTGSGFYEDVVTSHYRIDPNGGQSFKDAHNRMKNLNKNLIGQKMILKEEINNGRTAKLIEDQIIEANKLLLGMAYEILDKRLIIKHLKEIIFKHPLSKKLLVLYSKSFFALFLPKAFIKALRKN